MIKKYYKDFLNKLEPYFIFKISASILTQFSSLFLIYLLSPREFGYLTLIISVAQVMFTLTSGWSNGAIINLGTKKFAESGSYKDILFYRTLIVLGSFILVSLGFLLFRPLIFEMLHSYSYLKYVYYLFIGYVLYDFSYQLLYPGNKNNLQSILELTYTFLLFLSTVLFVKNIIDYTYIFLAYSTLFFVLTIISYFYFFGNDKFVWNVNDFKEVLKYSTWQLMSVLGIYLINLGNNYIFVFNHIPVTSIGLYNFAFKLFSGFTVVFGLFGILIPKWVHQQDFNPKAFLRKINFVIAGLSIGYILLALIIEPFIFLVGKSDYLDSVRYFYLLFPAFIFMCFSNLMNTVIANTKFFRFAQYAIVIQVVLIFLLGLPLVHFYNVIGAVISATISYLVCSIYFYYLYNKVSKEFVSGNKW